METARDTLIDLFNSVQREPSSEAQDQASLYQRYQQLISEQPKLRRRDQGVALAEPEAALIDAQCGVNSIRLLPEFAQIIHALPSLGYIMTLTRNDSAVHERKGIYSNISIKGPMGLVITDDRKIDLRIILSRWVFGFAVQEETAGGMRYSLQFFDKSGVAIQKIYLQDDSDYEAYLTLVKKYANTDTAVAISFVEQESANSYASNDQVDRSKLLQQWQEMTNVHQFMGILKQHNINRAQACEIVGAPLAQSFAPQLIEQLLSQIAKTDLSIMCFVGNQGNIQIHTGAITTVKTVGPWLNILDPEFNLHLLTENVASAWVVKKPTVDGEVTSVDLYDAQGTTIAQFFGQRVEGDPENERWRSFAQSLLTTQVAA